MTRVWLGLLIMVGLPVAYLLAYAFLQAIADADDIYWRE